MRIKGLVLQSKLTPAVQKHRMTQIAQQNH